MKPSHTNRVFFLSAKRTPFGKFLGGLSPYSAIDLGVMAAQAAIKEGGINPNVIDQVVFGNVLQTSKDAIYLARHIGLRCEIPEKSPALTVNRLCGSGFEAIMQGARLLKTGEASCVLVGGSESMSQAPFVLRGARVGLNLGQGKLEDSLWECLHDTYANMPMALTAENLADIYHISQEEVDQYSLLSQQRYQQALKENIFDDEIAPVELGKKDKYVLARDEHPRADSSLVGFKKLPKVFKANGVIHAGAASGICDGAAGLIMCNEEFLKRSGQKPLGEYIACTAVGCDPKIMGIGPVHAIRNVLGKTELSLDDMSMVEINEAFAPQVLAVAQELRLAPERINIHGGALALGHPLAASGARIITHMLHSLKKNPGQKGLGSACIGGGQGIAMVIQS